MPQDTVRDTVYVKSIRKSLIPKIFIVDLVGESLSVTMDMHEDVFEMREGDRYEFVLSHQLPEYRDGIDFCARGVVAGVKDDEKGYRTVISLYGLLVVVYPREKSLLESFRPVDDVYLCLKK